ncbi:hypothetical protein OS493_040056, partial [Desmophyllum pertusum]
YKKASLVVKHGVSPTLETWDDLLVGMASASKLAKSSLSNAGPVCVDIEFNKKTVMFVSQVVASFIVWTVLLLGMSYHVFKSWDFLTATHGFILQVSDLTPNMGLFWYFFYGDV